MSTYAASISPGATTAKLTIAPSSTYQVRIARIEVSATPNGNVPGNTVVSATYSLAVIPTGTATSGTSVTPVSMAGGPATTATVKSGATTSGTAFTLHQEQQLNTQTDLANTVECIVNLNSNYTTPFEFIVSSGSVVVVSVATSISTSIVVVVYYEEIRTPRTL